MRNVLLGCDRLLTEIPDGGYNKCDTQEQLFEEGCTNESSMTRNKKYKKRGLLRRSHPYKEVFKKGVR